MRIERVALHARPFGDHADGGLGGARCAVQIDGSFDDAPPGVGLLLGPAFEGIGPCHNFIAHICASIIDKLA